MSKSTEFLTVFMELMDQPINPHEKMPLSNKKGAIFGICISFHVLTWVVVGLRLHTRLRVVREPGWDDLFVTLAAVFNLIAIVAFLAGSEHGLGQHLIHIFEIIGQTMYWLYLTNAAYYTTTVFIKVSLLCQYLRFFTEGLRRKICIILLGIIVVWGAAFSFMAWFPCFPVSGFWNRLSNPPPRCYGFGYRSISESKSFVLAFAATNMSFDIAIFLIPLLEYSRPGLRRKEVLAMTGLFTMGFLVVLMAVLRLWSAWRHGHNRLDTFDFTWWYPEVLILSCLEVDFAIMCASMPIFWPTVVASWSGIFVTKEVHVTHHQRLDDSNADFLEMGRTNSLKSTASTEGLTTVVSQEHKTYHHNFDAELGKAPNSEISKINVNSHPQKSRKRWA